MFVSISDEMVSGFLSGLVVVLALVAVGCLIALILSAMARRFPFTRLALVLALTPLSFVQVMEYPGDSSLNLYAMIVLLLGITIDGINYLLEPKSKPVEHEAAQKRGEPLEKSDSKGNLIVWEKAE